MNSRQRPARVHPQKLQPTANNSQSQITMHHNCVELNDDPPLPGRSLKRKKSSSPLASVVVPGSSSPGLSNRSSERAENRSRVPATSQSLRVFSAMGRPPSLGPDLLVHIPSRKDKVVAEESSKHSQSHRRHCNDVDETDRQNNNIPVDRHMFTGPLAVAEYERMKKEIESLKESLHESRKLSRRQAKVITQ